MILRLCSETTSQGGALAGEGKSEEGGEFEGGMTVHNGRNDLRVTHHARQGHFVTSLYHLDRPPCFGHTHKYSIE